MILREAHVKGFGCLADQRFTFGEGLTVVFGPNESGKTTLVDCLVRLLYGYPEHMYVKPLEERKPWKAQEFAASLIYALDDGRVFETRRDFSRADVPTQTIEQTVMRPVPDLSGTRKASPGAALLNLSLEAYEAAAVMRAGEFSQRPDDKDNKAYQALAERIAALVGSAGEAGAAAALERLDGFARELGTDRASSKPLSTARTQVQAARDALETYRRDADQMRSNLTTRAALVTDSEVLAKRASDLNSRIASAQLGALRTKIAQAERADENLAGAVAERDRIAVSPQMLERAKRIDTAIDAWRDAKATENAAMASSQAKEDERNDVLAQIKECEHKLGELEATIRSKSAAIDRLLPESAGTRVSAQALAHLEALSDLSDQQEAEARKKETQARVTRSRPRPGALAALSVSAVALIALGIGAVSHVAMLLYAGMVGMLAGGGLLVLYLLAQRGRTAAERALEAEAYDARAVADEAAANLGRECAEFQLADIRGVRRANAVQAEIDRFSQARAAAEEMVLQTRRQQTLLETRFNEFDRATRTLGAARERASEAEAALTALLDDANIRGGDLEGRIAAFRQARMELERALEAEQQIGGYRAAKAGALGGRTLADLHDQATGLERQGVEACEGDLAALQAELNGVVSKQRENDLERQRIAGELKAFDRQYGDGGAPLEERLAACELEEARLARARDAALVAREAIDKAKDAVHKDFAPHLNALAGPALANITHQRYTEVAIDPKDFALRVRAPEHGASVEMNVLSSGTQEQLTLVLRAATAQALGSGERVPLLLDDALAHADERRLPAAVRQLGAIAQRQQVVLFTQRASVLDAARQLDGVCVIHMSGPAMSGSAAGAASTAT